MKVSKLTDVHCIRNLNALDGQEVNLRGWIYNWRSSGKISFLQLRDGTGICQCVFVKGECEDKVFESFEKLHQESCVQVSGIARREKRSPSGFEITGKNLKILSTPSKPYPITPKEHGIEFLMSHRHLWLRSKRQHAILRVRSALLQNIHAFFQSHGFVLVSAPILTPNACEGTSTLFSTEYFGEKAFLSQSGQLYMEAAAAAHQRVYCLGPTFRAEKSKTRRHLTEFWMVEPEIAFCTLTELMEWVEAFVEFIVQKTLEQSQEELIFLERNVDALKKIRTPFPRLHYKEAMTILKKEQKDFVEGKDLGATDESILSKKYEKPLLIHHYPQEIKAFYMKEETAKAQGEDKGKARGEEGALSSSLDLDSSSSLDLDSSSSLDLDSSSSLGLGSGYSLSCDLLAPEGYGEIVGGGQREDSEKILKARLKEHQLKEEAFDWYLDLRRFGTFPHAGFGLGIERALAWICGLKHVRETIPFPRLYGRMHP